MSFVCTEFKCQTVLFETIDRTVSRATTPGQSRPRSNGNEGILCIPQSFSVTGPSSSDCLISYTRHSFGGRVLPLCRDAVGVFYSCSWLGCIKESLEWSGWRVELRQGCKWVRTWVALSRSLSDFLLEKG